MNLNGSRLITVNEECVISTLKTIIKARKEIRNEISQKKTQFHKVNWPSEQASSNIMFEEVTKTITDLNQSFLQDHTYIYIAITIIIIGILIVIAYFYSKFELAQMP